MRWMEFYLTALKAAHGRFGIPCVPLFFVDIPQGIINGGPVGSTNPAGVGGIDRNRTANTAQSLHALSS